MSYNAKTKNRTSTQYIAIHCSATRPSMDIGVVDIDRWHRQKGWACVGYSYVIRRDGRVEEGRLADQVGAHCEGYNSTSLGICLVGGVSEEDVVIAENNFTPAQFASLRVLLTDLLKKYPGAKIQGHRDFPGVKKSCPSFSVKDWMKAEGMK